MVCVGHLLLMNIKKKTYVNYDNDDDYDAVSVIIIIRSKLSSSSRISKFSTRSTCMYTCIVLKWESQPEYIHVHCTVTWAPVFGRHQFFSTSEHYGKAHGSMYIVWMNEL